MYKINGKKMILKQRIMKWCNMFKNSYTDIAGEFRVERPSSSTKTDKIKHVNEIII